MTNPILPFLDPEYKEKRAREKARLRKDAAYVGALSIALTLVMQYAYSFIVKILIAFGVFSPECVGRPFLGLDNTSFLLFYSFVYAFSLLLPAVTVSFLYDKKFSPFSPSRPVPFFFALLLIVGAVGMCMFANIINSYISDFFREVGATVPPSPKLMVNTSLSFALNLFSIAVLPALLEEMIWRGYILRVLRAHGDGFAVVISALLFGLMHGNLRQIPFAFIVGLCLGFLYVCTNNIWIPVIVHFLNNGISVVMEYVSFSLSETALSWLYVYVIYGLITVGLLAVLILLLCARKRLRMEKTTSTLGILGRYRALFTAPLFASAVLLYFVFVFLGM